MLTLGACSALPWLRLWHLALLLVSTASVVSSATPVQVVAFLALYYSTVIFLFPSYLNLKTITWPGLVMTAPRHFVAESLSFSADFPHSYTYWKRATGMLERAWIEAKHAHCRVQAWLCWGWCVLSWPMNTCFLRPAAHTEIPFLYSQLQLI